VVEVEKRGRVRAESQEHFSKRVGTRLHAAAQSNEQLQQLQQLDELVGISIRKDAELLEIAWWGGREGQKGGSGASHVTRQGETLAHTMHAPLGRSNPNKEVNSLKV
jgi:hypothetical protein